MRDIWIVKGRVVYRVLDFAQQTVWAVNTDTHRLATIFIDAGTAYAFTSLNDANAFLDNNYE